MDLRGLDSREWRGFSDREIKRLQQQDSMSTQRHTVSSKPPGAVPVVKKAPPPNSVEQQVTTAVKQVPPPLAVDTNTDTPTTVVASAGVQSDQPPSGEVPTGTPAPELREESHNLEELQARQREIEAENKRTKALIEQKLSERCRMHKEESHKLTIVSQELAKLDKLVSKDVSVLRERIEEANRLYNNARKRFELAEAEYISSKADLFQRSEQKELLSEHLCAVIQQNESRKAAKLSELLKALNVAEEGGTDTPSSSEQQTQASTMFLRTPTPGVQHWPSHVTHNGSGGSTVNASHVTDNVAQESSNHADSHVTNTESSDKDSPLIELDPNTSASNTSAT